MLFPHSPQPGNPRRVVVTGAGIVSALGQGWKANAAGFRVGRTAFRAVSLFDVKQQRAKVAAEVDLPNELPPTHLSSRQRARLDRPTIMLLLAAREAARQAGWNQLEALPFVLGTTAGGMRLGEAYFCQAQRAPDRHRQQPTRALQYQAHTQARTVADALGFYGPVTIISNACASGADAVGQAWQLVRTGRAERVLTGGFDALCQLVFSGFDSLQVLSLAGCRPFDARRDGLTIGEGAGVLALENLEFATKRGAEILGEIIGYGAALDPYHLTQPHPEGEAALASMSLACESARIGPADVDYVNAHGTGTLLNDTSEARAISRWAGKRAADLPVSSTKASIGHVLGGAGAIEAVICLMSLREQWLPPEINFEIPDPACPFPIVHKPQDANLNIVLSNSFGFGGANATLLLRRWA